MCDFYTSHISKFQPAWHLMALTPSSEMLATVEKSSHNMATAVTVLHLQP
jgi:hypothetical protein